jgi:hypothetical protein
VEFAKTKNEDTVARFSGMPSGDYKGALASFMRTSDMKAANEKVRDMFRKTIAGLFGGEKFIPDAVRKSMRMEDFGKGKPLTARRINLVRNAIESLGGGKFKDAASIARAEEAGCGGNSLTTLARTANIYQKATGCTDAEAEAVAFDVESNARLLFECGGPVAYDAKKFKKGLDLMAKATEVVRQGLQANGIDPKEYDSMEFALSLDSATGDVTIRCKDTGRHRFGFEWTATLHQPDDSVTTTPFKFKTHLQKATEAMKDALKGYADNEVVDKLIERAKDDDLLYLLGYGKCTFVHGLMLDYGNQLRPEADIFKRLDAVRDNMRELRAAAKGDTRLIRGLLPQFINFRGDAVQPGVITKMFEEAAKVDLSPLEKISSASSPKEFAEAMCAVDKMVNRLAAASNAYGGKTMKDLGVDDVVSVTGLAIGILFARIGDDKLRELKTAFRSDNAAKVAQAFERFHERQFPAGANLTNKTREAFIQLVFIFNSTWALRMDALMAMDDILGTKFNTNPVSADSIPESDFKDVYDVIEKYLQEAHPESLV